MRRCIAVITKMNQALRKPRPTRRVASHPQLHSLEFRASIPLANAHTQSAPARAFATMQYQLREVDQIGFVLDWIFSNVLAHE
jgi:hypothetical protein